MEAVAGAAELAVRGVMSTPAPAPSVVADRATVVVAAVPDLFLVKRRCNRLCGVSVWPDGDADRTLAGIMPDDLFANGVSLQHISVHDHCWHTELHLPQQSKHSIHQGKHECGDGRGQTQGVF